MDVTAFRKNDQLAKKLILLTCTSSRLSLNDVNLEKKHVLLKDGASSLDGYSM